MTFLDPAILWALPFALAPILIYLLMRYRALRVVWGANYVLELALARLRRRLNLDQLLLLLLRALAAAALVVAFARPAASRRSAAAMDTGIHHVILLDASGSMQAGRPGDTRWSRGLDLLEHFARSWGRGERWSLYRVGETPEWIVREAAFTDPTRFREVLDGLTPETAAVAWGRALPALLPYLSGTGIELTIVADDQASAWAGIERALTGSLPIERGFWFNLARNDYENSAILGARLGSRLALAGHPVRLYVTARHFGAVPLDSQTLEILIDGVLFTRDQVAFLPGQTRQLSYDVVFEEDGDRIVTVRLGSDALLFDNTAAVGIDVRRALRVGVLRDPERTGKFDSVWPVLDYAARLARGIDPVLLDGDIPATGLDGMDVVVLDGGRTLTPALAAGLRDYVHAGGCLVLAPDAATDRDAWNRLFDAARMPLPAPLARFHSERLGGDRYQTFSRAGWPVSALSAFETDEEGDLTHARLYGWQTVGPPRTGVEVAGTFADGSPFLLRHDHHPGAVFLLAAGLQGAGGNLVAREFFLPFLIRLFTESASAGVLPRLGTPDEPARLAFRPMADFRGVAFQMEHAEPIGLAPRRSGERLLVEAPAAAGDWGQGAFLVLRESGVQRIGIGLQSDRPESDLTPIDAAMHSVLTERFGLVEVTSEAQLDEQLAGARTGGEYHLWVILALILLLIGEMTMERRFV